MADNPKKRGKPDRRSVALKQRHEREYMARELEEALEYLDRAHALIANQSRRLRAGFPKASQ